MPNNSEKNGVKQQRWYEAFAPSVQMFRGSGKGLGRDAARGSPGPRSRRKRTRTSGTSSGRRSRLRGVDFPQGGWGGRPSLLRLSGGRRVASRIVVLGNRPSGVQGSRQLGLRMMPRF
jgi:hypothetical protein